MYCMIILECDTLSYTLSVATDDVTHFVHIFVSLT